jgi:hypothetical protein
MADPILPGIPSRDSLSLSTPTHSATSEMRIGGRSAVGTTYSNRYFDLIETFGQEGF